jgi:hypothetical protein
MRRIGELIRELPKAKPGAKGKGPELLAPGANNSKLTAIADAGLRQKDVSNCERVANIPAADFERAVAAK